MARHQDINIMLNLNAIKTIADGIQVVAIINEIQVRVHGRIEYVWFCNNIKQARYRWLCAVDNAKRLAAI